MDFWSHLFFDADGDIQLDCGPVGPDAADSSCIRFNL